MYYVTLRFDNKKHGTYFVFNRHRFFFWGGGIFILYSLLVPGKKGLKYGVARIMEAQNRGG